MRAGTRATVICANTDIQNPTVFCRAIPSRVVAYVRLINDNAGNLNFAQGKFASQRMQDIALTLWASYPMPTPIQVQEESQFIQAGCAAQSGPAFQTKGLYPVVMDVPVNTVSDYGEVHVPIFSMDYAVRSVIREIDCRATPTPATVSTYRATVDDPQDPANAANQRWFEMSPVFKRVNFVVKTDGYSTITGRADAAGGPRKRLATADTRKTTADFLLLNEYMEPGQYYSLLSSPVADATAYAALQLHRHSTFMWRLDRDIATVSSGVAATVGNVRFIPIGTQDFTAQTLSISSRTSTFGPFTNTFFAAVATKTGKGAWTAGAASNELSLAPGSYSWTSQSTSSCTASIPSGTFTVTAGKVTEVFVLGSFACTSQSTPLMLVQKVPALATLPTSSCNPAPQSSFLFGAAGHIAPASSMVLLAISALLAALLAAF